MKRRKTKRFTRIDQVVQWRLCLGCGACVPACSNQAISLVNICEQGIRPIVDPAKCQQCAGCVEVCPGIEIAHRPWNVETIPGLSGEWGPVMEVWEGYATDPEIRHAGSSGGAATALGLFCLEQQGAAGVLQTGAGPGSPLENICTFSKSRADLLSCTGSRYCPAAPCEKLQWIRDAHGPSVFIGKPCDVVALRKSQHMDPGLDEKLSLAISIFCAGTPATKGTHEILSKLGVRPSQATHIRYRGYGWPGATVVETRSDDAIPRQMTYEESWGNILSRHVQFRCRLCPDSTGEFADISCGDPWYREIEPDEPGWSLVLVRTERGKEFLEKAMTAGYLKLERVDPSTLPRSQEALLARRRQLWGRLFAMRMMGVPVPCFTGFSLFRNWLRLPIVGKLCSIVGTLRRIVLRGLMKPQEPIVAPVEPHDADASESPLVSSEECESRWKA